MSPSPNSPNGPAIDVITVRGPQGEPGDPTALLAPIAPGQALTKDANGTPVGKDVLSPPVQRPLTLVPKGVKLRGANIAPQPANNTWAAMWTAWPWTSWIKPQIDEAKAAGANAIRFIGGLGALQAAGGTLTRAQYLANQKQYVEYCQAQGLYVYATGCAFAHCGTLDINGIVTELTPIAQALNAYPNVIGMDVSQEAIYEGPLGKGWSLATTAANCATLYAALKTAGVTYPLTFSHTAAFNDLRTDAYASIMDFVDYHAYSLQRPAEVDSMLARFPARAFILGEWGQVRAASIPTNDKYSQSIVRISRDARCDGAFRWTVRDQDPSLKMGINAADGTPYADVHALFSQIPTRDIDVLALPAGSAEPDNTIIWQTAEPQPGDITAGCYSKLGSVISGGLYQSGDVDLTYTVVGSDTLDAGSGTLRVHLDGNTGTTGLTVVPRIPFRQSGAPKFIGVLNGSVLDLYVQHLSPYQSIAFTPTIQAASQTATFKWQANTAFLTELPSGTQIQAASLLLVSATAFNALVARVAALEAAGGPVTTALLTEIGDFLATEAGDLILI